MSYHEFGTKTTEYPDGSVLYEQRGNTDNYAFHEAPVKRRCKLRNIEVSITKITSHPSANSRYYTSYRCDHSDRGGNDSTSVCVGHDCKAAAGKRRLWTLF